MYCFLYNRGHLCADTFKWLMIFPSLYGGGLSSRWASGERNPRGKHRICATGLFGGRRVRVTAKQTVLLWVSHRFCLFERTCSLSAVLPVWTESYFCSCVRQMWQMQTWSNSSHGSRWPSGATSPTSTWLLSLTDVYFTSVFLLHLSDSCSYFNLT